MVHNPSGKNTDKRFYKKKFFILNNLLALILVHMLMDDQEHVV